MVQLRERGGGEIGRRTAYFNSYTVQLREREQENNKQQISRVQFLHDTGNW